MLKKKNINWQSRGILRLVFVCFLCAFKLFSFAQTSTVQTDSIAPSSEIDRNTHISETKSVMENDVSYSAKDSIVMLADGTVVMYNESKVVYGDIELEAYYIRLNRDSSMIYAEGIRDSTGAWVQTPIFKDGGDNFESETIKYNFETGKGLIYNVASEQADGYVSGGVTKRVDEENLCMKNGRYTTCSNKDHPHFYLNMTKAKVKPGKSIVTGPAYLVLEDVPLPLAIPFGFFPVTSSYSSGFVMPSYGEEQNRGFFLKDGGYYFAISDYVDLKVTGDIYSLGSWALNANSRYKKRYKFSGNFSSNYRINVSGDKELSNYSKSKDFAVRWTHSQDPKSSPYSTFSASVNFSSSSYETNDLDRIYNINRSNNHKSSSVSFTKRFPEAPFNISLSANASQNAADSTVSVSLPQLAISMNRIYPFKRKRKMGADRWYEKIGVSYSGNISNSFSGYQADLFSSNIITDWKNGMKHAIPVSTSFQLFNHITISPSFSYTERWYTSSVEQTWNEEEKAVRRDTTWGFNRVYDYSTSLGFSTKLYGMYRPSPKFLGKKVQAIRHVMTPSVSLSWRPDFGQEKYGYYGTYQYMINDSTWAEKEYSRYEGAMYGTPGKGESGSIGLSLNNNVEMKVRDDRDTTAEFRKVKLIDRMSFSSSYNMMADSLNWSNIGASLGFTIFKKSVNISANFDPYSYNPESGSRINRSYLKDFGKPARLTRASTSLGLSISDKKIRDFFQKRRGESPEGGEHKKEGSTNQKFDKDGYLIFGIPWSVNFSYSISLNNKWVSEIKDYEFEGNSNLTASGNLTLTDKWKCSFSSGYNFREKKMASTRFSVSRDLHCFSMSASFVPIGTYKSYTFSISANSSMLKDLKYDKRNSPYDNSIWD